MDDFLEKKTIFLKRVFRVSASTSKSGINVSLAEGAHRSFTSKRGAQVVYLCLSFFSYEWLICSITALCAADLPSQFLGLFSGL